MSNTRKVAVDILDGILTKGAYSNILLNTKLNKSNLDDRDKGLVTEIVYGTLKYKYTIDLILNDLIKNGIKKADSYVLNILRAAVYQIRYLDKIPEFAAVNESVEIAKKHKSVAASKFVNGVLRNYLRNKDKIIHNADDALESICFDYSFEPWMVRLFVKQYGLETTKLILNGLNSTPNVTIRVNNLKTNYEEALEILEKSQYVTEEGKICPEAIRIVKGSNIERNPLFKAGFATVQDESAMLVAPSMDLVPGIQVLDLCSAPGGKTTHISEIMNNSGKIYAFDIHKDKLSLIKKNAERLGVKNITCDVLDASIYNENLKDYAERVLIDVPCSGLGIIRKKPEIKWSKDFAQLKELVKTQRLIMENAAKYVKAGGILLYSTCTLNKDENEENIKWFLSKFQNYSLEPVYWGNVDNIIYNEFGATILPDNYMDGFFIAKLKRIR